jgi:dephospho-CoA kinase
MRIIGLTGGIGSGKTTVARFLNQHGAVIIDADKIGHEALSAGSPVKHRVIEAFGREILIPDGNIDRRALARIVFSSPEKLAQLNDLVHPWMYATMKSRLETLRHGGERVVVLDAAILIEAGWQPLVEEIWLTVASQATIIQRLRAREDGLSEADVLLRIRRQLPNEERIKHARVVINTDCPLSEVAVLVNKLWEERILPGTVTTETGESSIPRTFP